MGNDTQPEIPTRRRRVRVSWALALALGWLLGLAAASSCIAAEATPNEHRYLLIVETSSAMERRLESTVEVVGDLLRSEMKGQLRPGDSIGLWTFNQEVHAGGLPVQLWTRESREAVAQRVTTYIRQQRFEKEANLKQAVPGIQQLIKASEAITLILITSGLDTIHGTPFDTEINDCYALWRSEQTKARKPFVTLLRAHQGTLTSHVVSPAQWPLELPPLPDPPKPRTTTTDPTAATNQAAVKTPLRAVAPLIVTGKKASTPEPAVVIPPATAGQPAGTLATTNVSSPSAVKPATVEASPSAANLTPTTSPAAPSANVAATPTVAAVGTAVPAVKEAPTSAPQPLAQPAPTPTVPATSVTPPKPAAAAVQVPPPVAAEAPQTESTPAVAAPESAAPPAQVATVPPPPTSRTPFVGLWLLIAFGVVLGVVILLLALRRRPNRAASLITESIDRNPPKP